MPRAPALALVLLAAALAAPPAAALFSARTESGRSTFTAAASFGCGGATVLATRDATLSQEQPATNLGSLATNFTRTIPKRARVAIGFDPLPRPPAGCALVAATLRMRQTLGWPGTHLQAYRYGGAWTESGVTWSTQASPAGAPAPAVADEATGLVEIDVTDHLRALLAGPDNGLVIVNRFEASGSSYYQYLSSREGADPPRLEIRWG